MDRQTAFFSGPYDEAMALLVESRNYVAYMIESDQRLLSASVRLQVSYESMRITSRLTQVMAWLLAQKAVFAGEITLAELASDQYALGGASICANNDSAAQTDLPARLRGLLESSHKLYERVSRLDEMVRRKIFDQPQCAAQPQRAGKTRPALAPVG